MTRLRAVVFDFDGVIVESEAAKDAAFAELFGRWPEQRDAMLSYHRLHRSLPRRRKLEELARRLGRAGDEDYVDSLGEELSLVMLERVAACPLVPGARELLGELAPLVHVAVASVTPERDLVELLRRLGLSALVAAVYGDPPTPKADAVRRTVAARAAGDAAAVVMVGDAPSDREVARSCGVRFIARDSGIPFGEDPPPAHRDLIGVAGEIRGLLA